MNQRSYDLVDIVVKALNFFDGRPAKKISLKEVLDFIEEMVRKK